MTERPRKIGSLVPPVAGATPASRGDRCPIALVTGTRDHLTQETVDLLRRRLGVAAVIALAPMALVFIPKTWQRCAALVGGAALLPVLITAGVGLTDSRLAPHLAIPLVVMAVVLGAGVAIAVFGSHRIRFLEQEASQARQLGQYRLI